MDVYEELREILDAHPVGAPKSEAFDDILQALFTPDEAGLAVHMSFAPKSAEEIAKAAGITPEEAGKKLEAMADKVVIFCREKDGKRTYGLLPTIPGLFEFPLMKGADTTELKRLGELWENYHSGGMGASFAGGETPFARIIPVDRSLTAQNRAHPYEEVKRFIDETSYIALAQCACRVSVKACDAPLDVCLIFGTPGKFLVQRGYAREITREEGYKVLDRAEEAGLVHTSNNSADRPTFICNCCNCCCTILRCRTQLDLPNAFATSAFVAQVDAEECTGCATCADERCPMEAIDIRDDVAVVNEERCIGCGLCVTYCPSAAITLVRRAEPPEIPANMQEVGIKVAKEKGKFEKFLKIMQR